jgi:nucleotide-binding universal stress UspA family protein
MFKMTVVARLMPEDHERKLADDARQRLATRIKELARDDVQLDQAVRFGTAYKEALQFTRDIEADLIVMGSHKPKLKNHLLGSNAEQIVRHARQVPQDHG